MVDGSVGLNRLVDRKAVGRGDLALERAHDSRRHRALEPEGVPDGHDRVAHPDSSRVTELGELDGEHAHDK